MQKMQINFSGAMARKRQFIVGGFVLVSVACIAGLGYYYYSVVAKQTVEPIEFTLAAPAAGMNPAMPAPEMAASGAVPGATAAANVASGVPAQPGQPQPGPVGTAPVSPGVPAQPMALTAMTAPPAAPAATQASPTATPPASPASAAKPVGGGFVAPEATSLSAIVGRPDDSTVRSIGELVRGEVQKAVREAKKEADLAIKAAQAAEPPPINMTSQGASAPKPPKPAMAKMGKLLVPPEPINTDIVETLSIIGRVGQEKAEVSFNGVAITVNKNQRAGSYMVNNIDANCVYLTDRFNKPMNSCILR